ncbi:MAG: PD-(D/E)XK nuclease family protein [Clostridiales bacterium]|nr:PD-(D/E)XK nuclease family protein [Clostridiales bacterium]
MAKDDRKKGYPALLTELAQKLRARTFSQDEYYIVLTPDRYTQTVERELFSGGGALDCEVLTLSRLASRVVGDIKTLSREDGVMIVARAIDSVKDKLEYYGRAARFHDFAREVYQTLLQIASSDVDIEKLSASGRAASKLRDLALIKAEYDKLKAENLDAPDRLAALIQKLPTDELIAKSHVYAIGYAFATKLNARVFSEIKKYAKSFELFGSSIPLTAPRKSMTVFGASDRISQYKEVATLIREYIDGGADSTLPRRRYSDVSVVCPSPRALSRILREYDIPFYTDECIPLAETPPLAALCLLYKLKKGADGETLASFCKNPYSGCDADDAEKLQNYIVSHGISYGAFDIDIDDAGAARALKHAKDIVDRFTGGFADACENVMTYADFQTVYDGLTADVAGSTDIISPIHALTSLVKRYGTNDFDADATAFFAAARAVEIKSLPRERDRVTVTMPKTLRMTACKKLFITDFNEGVLPAVTSDTGLISDRELDELGGDVEPSVAEMNKRERAELRAVTANAEDVVCSYCTSGGARPAAFINELAFDIFKYDISERQAALAVTDDGSEISKYACVVGAAREIAARKITKHAESVCAAVGKSEKQAAPFEPQIELNKKRTLSASELTHWFTCPYKRFLSDAIGLKERKTSALGAIDFGIVLHDFMKMFIDSGDYDCSRQRIEKLIIKALDNKEIKLDSYLLSRITDDAVDYATAAVAVIEAGDYIPAQTEKSFTFQKRLGKNANTTFYGVIDRVDVYEDKARIIDYKTGSKTFDFDKCISGLDMQLPLYAAAVNESGREVTGMFYQTFAPRYDAKDADGRLSGCLVKDTEIASRYDRCLELGERSKVIPAQFKFDKDGNAEFSRPTAALVESCEFDELIEKCVRTADVAADEIASGYIARSPVVGACDYCAYRGICGGSAVLRAAVVSDTEGD